MIKLFFYKSIDLLDYFLISQNNQDYFSFLKNETSIRKIRVQVLNDIYKNIESQDIFSQDQSQEMYILEDTLKLDTKTLLYFQDLESEVILATNSSTLFKEIKKVCKLSSEFSIEIKKVEIQTLEMLAVNHFKLHNWSFEGLEMFYDRFEDYQSFVDYLDMLRLSSNPQAFLEASFEKIKTPLFWLKLNPENLTKKDLLNWYLEANDEQVQLILSLIFTKLEKSQSSAKSLILKDIINRDLEGKTTLSGRVSLKLFLFFLTNASVL